MQIMVPCRAAGNWCLYVWDMVKREIHVFDPVSTTVGEDALWAMHDNFVAKLHMALHACKEEFFVGWDEDFDNFHDHYLELSHPPAARL